MAKRGRELYTADWAKIDSLLMAQCQGTEIAESLGISPMTLYRSCKREKKVIFDKKQETKDKMITESEEGESYVILSFTDYATKVYFMELVGEKTNDKYIKGEKVLSLLEEKE